MNDEILLEPDVLEKNLLPWEHGKVSNFGEKNIIFDISQDPFIKFF